MIFYLTMLFAFATAVSLLVVPFFNRRAWRDVAALSYVSLLLTMGLLLSAWTLGLVPGEVLLSL